MLEALVLCAALVGLILFARLPCCPECGSRLVERRQTYYVCRRCPTIFDYR